MKLCETGLTLACIEVKDCKGYIFWSENSPNGNGLKAVDTIGKCQRLASTVGVSQHMHKITNL